MHLNLYMFIKKKKINNLILLGTAAYVRFVYHTFY